MLRKNDKFTMMIYEHSPIFLQLVVGSSANRKVKGLLKRYLVNLMHIFIVKEKKILIVFFFNGLFSRFLLFM